MVSRFGIKLSKGILPQGNLGKIRGKMANNLGKVKQIIKNIRNEDKKIDKDIGKLLKESKKFSKNIEEFEKINNDSLHELKIYIELMRKLYGNNLNSVYPEIIKLENYIGDLYKVLEDIKNKRSLLNSVLNEIHKAWETHKHKISKT
jgi:predicted RNase H-like nuclease (RuvC/YqgF family)